MSDPRVSLEGQLLLDHMKAAQEALVLARRAMMLAQPYDMVQSLEQAAGASLAAADMIRKVNPVAASQKPCPECRGYHKQADCPLR